MRRMIACCAAALAASGIAAADVRAKGADGFVLQVTVEAPMSRDDAWARLVDIGAWWEGSHTYSGDAASLSLDAQAGGCWCEVWSGGEVEHGRVVMVMPKQVLRVAAALGPLQEMGVSAALTFTLSDAAPGKTRLVVDYKVSGSAFSALDIVAPAVDQVITAQAARFAKPS